MAGDAADRTEPATPKRREEARRKGDVPQSRDVSAVAMLAAGVLLLTGSAGAEIFGGIADQARTFWSGAFALPEGTGDFHALLIHLLASTGHRLAPFAATFVAVGIGAHVLQTGPYFSSVVLAPKASRLSPATGLPRMLGAHAWIELAKAAVKVAIAFAVAWHALAPAAPGLVGLLEQDAATGLGFTLALVRRLAVDLLAALALLAAADFAWARRKHERDLRMTRQEVRDELREREGSPHVRARLRALQRELSRSRMIAAVAKADVVVVNPVHFAVALVYVRSDMDAPKVVAKGRNHLALRMRRAAVEHGVPIVENPPLAQLLYRTARVEREIPAALFQAVAEVLAHVYRIDPRRAASWRAAS
jgi:flagellar biosynthetic protein FlhB